MTVTVTVPLAMLICLACAVIAVLLAMPPPVSRSIPTRLAAEKEPRARQRKRWAWVVAALVAVAFVGGTGALLAGPSGAAVGTSAGVTLATAVRLLRLRRRRHQAQRRRLEVARGCAAIASQVRVGRVPSEALSAAAEDWPVLAAARRAQQLGGEVAQALLAGADRPGCEGLGALARAWRLSTETGAPMASALDQVALSLRRDEALQRTVAAELAGPRATGTVMAILPVVGIGMGYLLGGRPLQFLLEGPLGWGCLVGGVGLACAGVLWVDRLARVAEEA